MHIRSHLYNAHHHFVGISIGLPADILQSQDNLGSEMQELHERALVINIRNYGLEGVNTAVSNNNMGAFYYLRAEESQTAETKKDYLQLSDFKYKESLRIFTKVFGPDHLNTIGSLSQLSTISRKLSET
jgi:hypothetical protein